MCLSQLSPEVGGIPYLFLKHDCILMSNRQFLLDYVIFFFSSTFSEHWQFDKVACAPRRRLHQYVDGSIWAPAVTELFDSPSACFCLGICLCIFGGIDYLLQRNKVAQRSRGRWYMLPKGRRTTHSFRPCPSLNTLWSSVFKTSSDVFNTCSSAILRIENNGRLSGVITE